MDRRTASILILRPRLSMAFVALVLTFSGCGPTSNSNRDSMLGASKPPEYPAGGPHPAVSGTVVATDDTNLASDALDIIESDWEFHGQAAKKYSSEHYTLHTTGNKSWMRQYAVGFSEEALAHYRIALANLPEPSRKLTTFLFANRSEWQHKTRDLMGSHADVYLNLGRGGYSTSGTAVLYNIGLRDTFAIMAHEGWHQYTQVTFKNPLPTWLEEGIATYMEGREQMPGKPVRFLPFDNRQRLEALERAWAGNDLIKLAKLVDRSPQHFLEDDVSGLLTYYAQVWVLVHFFIHAEDGRYRESLRRVLEDAAAGRMVTAIMTSPNIQNHNLRRTMAASQFGPGVLLAYFNRSWAGEMQDQYSDFIERILTDPAYRQSLRESDMRQMGYAELNGVTRTAD